MVPSNPGVPGVPRGSARQGRAAGPGNLLCAQAQLSGAAGTTGRREGRSPISPGDSLRGRGRALFTQPVTDTVLTCGQQGGWERTPTASSGGTRCLVPQRPVCGKVGHGPIE